MQGFIEVSFFNLYTDNSYTYMSVDLELILVLGTLVTGIIALLDKMVLAEKRRKRILNETYDAKFGAGDSKNPQRHTKSPGILIIHVLFFQY